MITLPEVRSYTGDYSYDIGVEAGMIFAKDYLNEYLPKNIEEVISIVEKLKKSISFENGDVIEKIQILLDSLNEIKNG